ncbi:hypothetical protein A2875_03925 [Candidatus Gottesmanbacteria bacterium RIFCSPHIGHO2_01_FULL_46_14]|uniref:Nucleoside 2-deoxyribosyltransferase n=3 Tax=Patescibacteria group TaxID=1783273 RepID=A0A1F5ZMZ9_9BACT|nr:MAG: hypothetical protein UW78_C0021G0009 [Candidatus Azambacteria bacterium GW2011_GWA1_44_9]OGG13694.1 MAG: hypothetical protein A2875_03925 [Candidatus Gottesmanbacteria bacterium RIFCSPHIGHO2_01_FULL_46_14]OGG29553.1 MAG: hypothetical protein A2971_02170 [Candidatus Gottesmanbacteria bacterium RIFCSPLOWO2_01_FULL_46_21]
MKVYFTASLSQRNAYLPTYRTIITWLEKKHHTVFEKVLSYHLRDTTRATTHDISQWYKEWSSYIAECDVMLVEGSYPSSIHIGYEVGTVLSRGKPVILLFGTGKNPTFIDQVSAPRLIKTEYDEESLDDVLEWSFKELEHIVNRRFAFFVSPDIDEFLTRVSRSTGGSRSEYIRMLIEHEMRKHS